MLEEAVGGLAAGGAASGGQGAVRRLGEGGGDRLHGADLAGVAELGAAELVFAPGARRRFRCRGGRGREPGRGRRRREQNRRMLMVLRGGSRDHGEWSSTHRCEPRARKIPVGTYES